MAQKPQTRDIASFFRSHTDSIPAKRPSPSIDDDDDDDDEVQYLTTKPKSPPARTPKRPSPSGEDDELRYITTKPKSPGGRTLKRPSASHEDTEVQYIMTQSKQSHLRTPHSAVRFKEGTASPFRSPSWTGSGGSVKIAIRSPRPEPSQRPVTSFSSRLSALYKERPVRKQKDDVRSALPSVSPFFADLPSSTQSIVKDGKLVGVKGSDDEDSDGLSSLDDILGLRKSETVTSSSSPPELDADECEAERQRTMLRFTCGRSQPLVGRDKLRELYSKERDHKVDIGALMEDHFDDQEVEDSIAKTKQGYESARQDEERSRARADVDRNLLAAVVAGGPGEPDDLSRLMNAVERTEALNLNWNWSFFGPGGPQSPTVEPVKMPTDAQLRKRWPEVLDDQESRSRTFLSGFIGEVWSDGRLPDEIIQWTFDTIVQEHHTEIRRSYVQAFKCAPPEWVRTHLPPASIERLFLRIGASRQAVSYEDVIEPTAYLPRTIETPDYRYLLSVIELLMTVAPFLEVSSRHKLLAILARLALDGRVMNDARISVVVEDSLSELIELSTQKGDLAMARFLVADLGTCLTDPPLQAQLLKHLLCTSSAAAHIRIMLAHRFLLGTDWGLETDLTSWSIDIRTLTHCLHSGPFGTRVRSPSKLPDYTNMTASTYLLDIAIADGGRPASFASRREEVAFNGKVDSLADRIKAISASIADTGASHMRRTEAKEALEALHYRVLYAVRTEPRPKRSVFGGRDGEEYRAEERSKGFMTKFLARQKDTKSSSSGRSGTGTPSLASSV